MLRSFCSLDFYWHHLRIPLEVSIIYDSFTFAPTRRKYPAYKCELYALAEFVTKYDYLAKHPYHPDIVHTDHKPLIHLTYMRGFVGIGRTSYVARISRLNTYRVQGTR
jgi:hypothetical protein